jgi:hypothetical protein
VKQQKPPTAKERKSSAQWPAQFLASAELTRHGYEVAFTMGNHTPVSDLMVGHPKSGLQFWVSVRGLGALNAWWGTPDPQRLNLFYILVLVGATRTKDRFFILSQAEFDAEVQAYRLAHQSAKPVGGFNWTAPHKYENQWNKLASW